ncbi:hypothetical protein ACFX2J_017624 [Malus domestica]
MGKGIWIHWAIMVLHVVAILLCTRGFLLTRTEFPFYSNCSDASQSPCSYSIQEPKTEMTPLSRISSVAGASLLLGDL